jgi:hypothetical protein
VPGAGNLRAISVQSGGGAAKHADDFKTILRNRMKSLQLAGYTLPWCCNRFLRRVGGQPLVVRDALAQAGLFRGRLLPF